MYNKNSLRSLGCNSNKKNAIHLHIRIVDTAHVHSPLWKTFFLDCGMEMCGMFLTSYRDKNDTLVELYPISNSHANAN